LILVEVHRRTLLVIVPAFGNNNLLFGLLYTPHMRPLRPPRRIHDTL
jgi:hypothetical protein